MYVLGRNFITILTFLFLFAASRHELPIFDGEEPNSSANRMGRKLFIVSSYLP